MGFESFSFENNQPKKVEVEREEEKKRDERLGFESMEQREVIESFLDHSILSNYKKIDEGQNGIIGLVDLHTLKNEYINLVKEAELTGMEVDDEKLTRVFEERFGNLPEDEEKLAIKMLKIFSAERSNHESDIQDKMYKLNEEAKSENLDKKFANIPKVYFNRLVDLAMYPELKDKLVHDDVDVPEQKVNVMAMDFLNGENFDYYLHAESLIAKGFDQSEIKEKDYRWMQTNLIKESVPGFSRQLYNIRLNKDSYREDLESLASFLVEENGRTVPKEIFEKIRNTLELAHKNNIYHCDLHEKNIFLELDADRTIKDVSIIDWGESKQLTDVEDLSPVEKSKIAYAHEKGVMLRDDYILKYEQLFTSPKEIQEKERANFLTEIYGTLKVIKEKVANLDEVKTNKKLKAYKALEEEIDYLAENEADDKNFIKNLDRELDNFSDAIMPDDLEKFRLKLSLWLDVLEKHQGVVEKEALAQYLESNKSGKLYIENDKEKFVKYLKEKAKQ